MAEHEHDRPVVIRTSAEGAGAWMWPSDDDPGEEFPNDAVVVAEGYRHRELEIGYDGEAIDVSVIIDGETVPAVSIPPEALILLLLRQGVGEVVDGEVLAKDAWRCPHCRCPANCPCCTPHRCRCSED